MPLPDRDASNYGPRARRHYRRFQLMRPIEPDRAPWELPTQQRDSNYRESRKSHDQTSSSLWLLIVLAITVFTFICLILMIIGAKGLVSGF